MKKQTTVLVTGATDGIGRQTARELVQRGHRVWVHGRTLAKARSVAEQLAAAGAVGAELGSLDEVRQMAATVERDVPELSVLMNNAGLLESKRRLSADGYELTFAVNHLAPFLLTHLLLPTLRRNAPARVVNVSSGLHASGRLDLDDLARARRYDGGAAYSDSKLANVLFSNELARRLRSTDVGVFSLHPGVIGTKLLHIGFGGGGSPVEDGARTTLFAATDESLTGETALYLSNGRVSECSPRGRDSVSMRALYDVSCELVGITGLDP